MANSSNSMPKTRQEARDTGAAYYFTGKPCIRGHIAKRQTRASYCMECQKYFWDRWADGKRETFNGYRRKWREKPGSKAIERLQRERARELNPGREAEKVREWRLRNPQKAAEVRKKAYEKRAQNPQNRLDASIRSGIVQCIKKGGKNGRKSLDYLGYSREQLVKHLEKQFTDGMSWENYGQWHVDHIIPLKAFNFQTVDDVDFKRAWALSNLQPMWGRENQSKGAKLFAPFQPSLI